MSNGDFEVLERHATPRGELQLQRRGAQYEVISNGMFLMATDNGQSERLLITAALAAAASPRRVLIGGLGVGFSLGAALADSRVEQVTVVEIEGPLIEWNRGCLAPFSGHGLEDPRTWVVEADLVRWIQGSRDTFDAICLDIDNGPDWTVTEANQELYGNAGLAALSRLLAPGGAISFWSAAASPSFAARLAQYFTGVEVLAIPVTRGEPDCVYLARRR